MQGYIYFNVQDTIGLCYKKPLFWSATAPSLFFLRAPCFSVARHHALLSRCLRLHSPLFGLNRSCSLYTATTHLIHGTFKVNHKTNTGSDISSILTNGYYMFQNQRGKCHVSCLDSTCNSQAANAQHTLSIVKIKNNAAHFLIYYFYSCRPSTKKEYITSCLEQVIVHTIVLLLI